MSPNGYHTHIDCCLLSRSMSSSIHVGMHPLPFLSSLLSCLSFSFNYSCDLSCSEKPFMMHRRIQFLNSYQQVSVVYCKNVLCISCELKGQPNDHICIYIESYLSVGSHVWCIRLCWLKKYAQRPTWNSSINKKYCSTDFFLLFTDPFYNTKRSHGLSWARRVAAPLPASQD